jgi:hypothetical protein
MEDLEAEYGVVGENMAVRHAFFGNTPTILWI